jgi:class 3 adenylate cyclase
MPGYPLPVADVPETHYARSGSVHLAYQVFGSGPVDLLVVPGGFTHVELRWEEPENARFYRWLGSFARVIVFDKRGAGLSDRTAVLPPYEDQIDDVVAVMDAAASTAAVLFGFLDGAVLAALLAAWHPERSRGLIVESCPARVLSAPDYPWGFDAEAWEQLAEQVDAEWFLDDLIALTSPSRVGDHAYRAWFSRYARAGAGPGGLAAIMRRAALLDIREVLPLIRVPTVVLAPEEGALVSIDSARYVAEHIPDARLVVTTGRDALPDIHDTSQELVQFITGARWAPSEDRALATILFTDIVSSTTRLGEAGDGMWRAVLDRHDDLARRSVAQFGGRVVQGTGDGMLASFDAPGRAVHCARAFITSMRLLGIDVRAGLHTGEIERRGDDISGIAVHVAARVAALADAGELLVSSTVVDLVAGSEISFEDRGVHELKGVARPWHLFAVTNPRTAS